MEKKLNSEWLQINPKLLNSCVSSLFLSILIPVFQTKKPYFDWLISGHHHATTETPVCHLAGCRGRAASSDGCHGVCSLQKSRLRAQVFHSSQSHDAAQDLPAGQIFHYMNPEVKVEQLGQIVRD